MSVTVVGEKVPPAEILSKPMRTPSCEGAKLTSSSQEELAASDPRRAVAEALSYFGHNAGRMKYPEYRRAGLPTTSSLVESLVGEVNARVKGKQKYWSRGAGAEAILQLRAALLSEDGRLDRYLGERPGSPYR